MDGSKQDKIKQIKHSIVFLCAEWEIENSMQDTINTEHTNYKQGSEMQVCYAHHQARMMRFERIRYQLESLIDLIE